MKKIIKKIAIKFFNPIAKRLGYVRGQQIVYAKEAFEKNSLLEIFFDNIKQMGFTPKHIIDVGANHGTWTRETLKYCPEAYYTLIEPQEWLKPSLQDILDVNSKVTFNAVGAGDKSGSFMFTIVNRDDSCSFRYTEEEAVILGVWLHGKAADFAAEKYSKEAMQPTNIIDEIGNVFLYLNKKATTQL